MTPERRREDKERRVTEEADRHEDFAVVVAGIKRALRWLVVATVVVYIVVLGLAGYGAYTTGKMHDGLCSFTDDLQTRIETSEQFLVDHPDGTPGIPAEVIRSNIENQTRTFNALQPLGCD